MTTTYEVVHDYTAYGECARFFRCRDPEVVIAGPADTGKSLAALFKIHRCALKYPEASIVIARKQLTDTFSTILQTFVKKVIWQEIEAGLIRVYGGEKPQWFDYPKNGSRIWVAGMDKSSKVLSGEHDLILTNQTEEFSLPDWEVLTSRTTGRAGHMPYSQTLGDANPGPQTHWIMSRSRNGGPLTRFISTHRDNPELYDQETGELTEQGAERLARLRNLTGTRLKRLYLGLWVAPEGAIYDVFEEEKHKVKARNIPGTWPRVVGIDPIGAYIGALWVAWDPKAKILNVYREYVEPFGVPTRKHAENILRLSQGESVFRWFCGAPSERQQRLDFESYGIPAEPPPYGDLWPGIDKVIELLADFILVIHDNCPVLLSELGSYRRKMRDGIATDAIVDKHSFHLLDCLRYACVGLTAPEATSRVTYDPVRIGRY